MSVTHFRRIYPFSAIVGQDLMKTALILNAVNPGIGGVLIKGERGTAKSTAVRSLAALLPEHDVVPGCTFGCDPNLPSEMCEDCRTHIGDLPKIRKKMQVVELPVSATEDKVVGSLDISAAIKSGEKRFEPGILAQAHRNILYVDEVNLLNDHIVDVLLDAAAMGVNVIEREGVSYVHPSCFILVGTMNPEEGDLRPQLLDRFGLCVQIAGMSDPDVRMEVILRRMAYDADPAEFSAQWTCEEAKLTERICTAQKLLPSVVIPEAMLRMIVQICIDSGVDGHRADIVMMKTATTLAAYCGRYEVSEDDIRTAASLVLPHRMKKTPFSENSLDEKTINDSIEKSKEQQAERSGESPSESDSDKSGEPDASGTTQFAASDPFGSDPQNSTRS